MNITKVKSIVRDRANRARYMISRFRDEVEAVAAVEFAFLAPLMLLMYVGTIEVSNAMSANRKLSRVSSTIGDLLTQAECYSDDTLADIMEIADDIMYPYGNTVSIQVNGVQIDNNIAKVVWSRGFNGASQLAKDAPYTVPNKIKTNGNFLVAAKMNMAYQPAVGWFSYSSNNTLEKDTAAINMSEEMFLRPRVGDDVTLNNC